MESLLQSLASSGVSFVSKAAFTYATSVAMGRISILINSDVNQNNSLEAKRLLKSITRSQETMNNILGIISPIITLCELAGARSNSTISATMGMANQLSAMLKEMASLSDQIESSVKYSIPDLENLLLKFDGIISFMNMLTPYLHLSLQATGTSFSRNMNSEISPSILMQASWHICNLKETAGPAFAVKMYIQFEGSVRKQGQDWTWKEDFFKASLQIQNTGTQKYTIVITEELNDGRVHESSLPKVKKIEVFDIAKLYYANAGRILKIEGSSAPVLILKVRSIPEVLIPESISEIEWVAFELLNDSDSGSSVSGFSQNESADEKEDSSDNEYVDSEKDFNAAEVLADKLKKLIIDETQMVRSVNSLCLLEYMIRICSLEAREKCHHFTCSDELICHYLTNQLTAQTAKNREKYREVTTTPVGTRKNRSAGLFG